MFSPLLTLAFAADDPVRVGGFWSDLLGRPADDAGDGVTLPGDTGQLALRFFRSQLPRELTNRVHLHLSSTSLADQERLVERALSSGGRHLDVGQRPDEEHVVLTDPEGNEFCVIEPDNAFLAGCGPLGEVACDGTRPVGVFWSEALRWPLVWDENEETAIQSPEGGTKVAWGGPPITPRTAHDRQRFEIATASDLRAEVERLISLGATQLDNADDVVMLADPDGIAFSLHVM